METMDADVPRSLRIGDAAPNFTARTTQGAMSLDQYRGRWVVFFSHPADFTPVCTSEFVALAKAAPQFEELDCALLGLSVDSLYSHVAWLRAIKDVFGVEVPFPVVEDPSMAVGYAYGMLDEQAGDASAVRATYFIDPEGIIRALNWYPMNVGRSVDEMLRTVRALQRSADGQAYTPADWQPGDDVLLPPALPCSADAAVEKLRVFAQPQRLMILSYLLGGERQVADIEAATGVTQPALSQQLAELRRAELVKTRREAKQVHYRLADDAAAMCVRTLEAIFGADDLAVHEAAPASRPSRARGASAATRPQNIGAAVFARVG
jgi:peroxiredoxin (alkyl hydroperoxide reductase subunit C)